MFYMKIKTWSSYFFLIPFVLSLIFKVYFMSFILLAVVLASLLYHLNKEKHYKILDEVFAFILILANIYLCYLFSFSFPYFYLAIVGVVFALFFYFREKRTNYNIYHTLWHIFSVLITIICLIGYYVR